MHEMAIVTRIIDAVCAKVEQMGADRVVSITLRVGEIRDFDAEWVQRYFDWFAQGTRAEGVRVEVVPVPVRYRCSKCGAAYRYDMKFNCMVVEDAEQEDRQMAEQVAERVEGRPRCPAHPHDPVEMVSGNELVIQRMVIE